MPQVSTGKKRECSLSKADNQTGKPITADFVPHVLRSDIFKYCKWRRVYSSFNLKYWIYKPREVKILKVLFLFIPISFFAFLTQVLLICWAHNHLVRQTLAFHIGPTQLCLWSQRGTNTTAPCRANVWTNVGSTSYHICIILLAIQSFWYYILLIIM